MLSALHSTKFQRPHSLYPTITIVMTSASTQSNFQNKYSDRNHNVDKSWQNTKQHQFKTRMMDCPAIQYSEYLPRSYASNERTMKGERRWSKGKIRHFSVRISRNRCLERLVSITVRGIAIKEFEEKRTSTKEDNPPFRRGTGEQHKPEGTARMTVEWGEEGSPKGILEYVHKLAERERRSSGYQSTK